MIPKDRTRDKYKVYLCKQCGKKRRIYWGPSRSENNDKDIYQTLICSQGHRWEYEVLTSEKIGKMVEEVIIPKVRGLFERDDTFYKSLMRR
jgi:hypothetical protein